MKIAPHRASAFTLIEVVIAAGIFAIFAGVALAGMTQVNRMAAIARMRTAALAAAQQRIDEVLTAPWQSATSRAAVLTAGTRTETNLPLNHDPISDLSGAQARGLRSDFTNFDFRVNATRETVIADLSSRQVRAVVTVTYDFLGRRYTQRMVTLRASSWN